MRKFLTLLLLFFVSLPIVQAQESHYSYRYKGTTYRAKGRGETSMSNKASSCQFPTQFTLSILSGRKTAWVVSPSKTIKLAGNGVQNNGGYYFVEPAKLEEVMSLSYEAYENFSMSRGLFVSKDYSSLIVISEEPSGSNGNYTRFDHYHSQGSVSAPNNPQRREEERKEAERVANERKYQQEAEQRERERVQSEAQAEARRKATINKPLPLANFRDTQGNIVESSYFCRGKKTLLITTMIGSRPNIELKKELEKYPQIASQIIYIHMRDGEGSGSRYKPHEPVSQNKIYSNVQDPVNQRWVFGTACPRTILLDEQGRVLAYLLGYSEKKKNELKALIDQMRTRTSAPYKIGDYYNDGEKEGVVFEVWDNGRSGKIVALTKSEKTLRWEEHSAERMNFDKEFGLLNGLYKRSIMNIAEWAQYRIGRYPVFDWCSNFSIGKRYYSWYLPNDEEWKEIWQNRALIDPGLVDKIGDYSYWTCSEKSANEAYYINGGSLISCDKSNGCFVRAVTTFGSLPKKRRPQTTTAPYRVGDYYSENGKRGVVFEVSEDGYSGKIVSLDYGNDEWCTVENMPSVGALSELNGAENMEAVKQHPDWPTKFPAFKWCANKGEGWYLPAKEELLEIARNKALLNQVLDRPIYCRQWSSTECFIINPYRNRAESCRKSERNEFRAVTTFGSTPSVGLSK